MHPTAFRSLGFTLVEMVVSITLLSLMAMVAVPMMRVPVTAYLEAQARVEATRELDTVQSRITADLTRALPNSVRITAVGGRQLLEFMEVRAEGRHRFGASGVAQVCPTNCGAPTNRDSLETACTERCFTTLGPLVGDAPVPATDWVVVNPLTPVGAANNPYFGGNVAVAAGNKTRLASTVPTANGVRMNIAPKTFNNVAASRRFFIVSNPVTYECNLANQRLTRYSGYPVAAAQPAALGAGFGAPLATGLVGCNLRYTAHNAAGRGGMVHLWLRFMRQGSPAQPAEFTELVFSAPVLEGG